MLRVNASAGPSSIEGIGLIANEDIPKGTVIWKHDPKFDIEYTPEEFNEYLAELPVEAQVQVLKYSYKSKILGTMVLCADDARFFNHSDNPNCISQIGEAGVEEDDVAAIDIKAGEELTCDYRRFDAIDHEEYI